MSLNMLGALALAAATAVPRATGPIPVTADSFPFMAANRIQEVVDLATLGYDGYLIKANEDPGRISRCATPPPEGDPRQVTRNVNVPVIRMIAQGDVLDTFTRRPPG